MHLDSRAKKAGESVSREDANVLERFALLTKRERQVMRLVIAGKTNRQIADRLSLSPRTIEVYRTFIRLKMNTKSVVELVTMATRYHLAQLLEDTSGRDKQRAAREPPS